MPTSIPKKSFALVLAYLVLGTNGLLNETSDDEIAVEAIDTEAMARCKQLHNLPPDNTSAYANQDCLLNCVFKAKATPHPLNEGLRCPLASTESFICHGGNCVEKIVNGRIALEILSATLSANADAYATACVVNSLETLTLPIKDRSHCTNCLTSVAPNGQNPVWNSACVDLLPKTFGHLARIYIELWSHHGRLQNEFVGGVGTTLPQKPDHSALDQEYSYNLVGGKITGTIKIHLNWTPIA